MTRAERTRRAKIAVTMTHAGKKLLEAAQALPEDERLELASELIASVDGPPDADWESAWLAELDRRLAAARDRGESPSEWSEVRARVLRQLDEAIVGFDMAHGVRLENVYCHVLGTRARSTAWRSAMMSISPVGFSGGTAAVTMTSTGPFRLGDTQVSPPAGIDSGSS